MGLKLFWGSQRQNAFVCCNQLKSFRNQRQKGIYIRGGLLCATPPFLTMFSVDVGEGTFPLKETKETFNNILNKIF